MKLFDLQGKVAVVTGGTGVLGSAMGRFGKPEELVGTAVWLVSEASRFVTGVVVAVDGGFLAYGGV